MLVALARDPTPNRGLSEPVEHNLPAACSIFAGGMKCPGGESSGDAAHPGAGEDTRPVRESCLRQSKSGTVVSSVMRVAAMTPTTWTTKFPEVS